MRIIHVTDTSIYNYDGISTYINELLECAEQKGDSILVLTTIPHIENKKRKCAHNAHLKVFSHIPILSSAKFKFARTKGIDNEIEGFKPDLIWIHTIGPLGIFAAKNAKKNNYPVIYTKHCFDGDLWCNHLKAPGYLKWFFRMIACIIENMVIKPADKIIYHFREDNEIKEHKFSTKFKRLPPPLSKKFVKENGVSIIQKEFITLGYCGRCDPEKGIETIFKSIRIFQNKYNKHKVRLMLIGDGIMAHELKKMYQDIDVTITGFVDNVIPYLDQLDAFVLASTTETTSLSSLEAYARGLTIFTTPVGYLGKNSNEFENVYTFQSPEELSNLIYQRVLFNNIIDYSKSICIKSSTITFSELHSSITAEYV